ncbi:MAG: RNA polymerase sigma factor [Bacteroidota bacterium]
MTKELETSFLSALNQYQHKLLRICSIYSINEEDRKDLFQEVMMRIWQAMPSFKAKSSLETWMFRIAINTCLRFRSDVNKKQEKIVRMNSFDIEILGVQEDNTDHGKLLLKLRHCIKELNESNKAITALYLEGLPYKEISAITGISENTIAVKMKRIKKKLLNCLNA